MLTGQSANTMQSSSAAGYPDTDLLIDGRWSAGAGRRSEPVINPATGRAIGNVAHAEAADLERAALAAGRGFETWKRFSAQRRYTILGKAADILRGRAAEIALTLTLEQGKPLDDAKREILNAAGIIEWFAEECRRAYGRTIPARDEGVLQIVSREPIGPVAAFTPWNFPVGQSVRKLAAALAAGCSIVLKGSEETPASVCQLVRAFAEAGVPDGVVNLVYGVPAEISEYLIAHRTIRKVSFTGSTIVGKQLAMLAGKHMKPVTMELGGHAPAIVFEDVDVDAKAKALCRHKYRNAGQVCTSPTRFLVHDSIYERFVDRFTEAAKKIKIGNGLDESVEMGPLANERRIVAMEALIADAVAKGGTIRTGGRRIGNEGFFFEPTVLTDVPTSARAMNEEPFGPVALIARFSTFDEAVSEANRLDYGLAAYAYTGSAKTAVAIGNAIESGMVCVNQQGLGNAELPFGGIKDSGYGSEGGLEGLDAYYNRKLTIRSVG